MPCSTRLAVLTESDCHLEDFKGERFATIMEGWTVGVWMLSRVDSVPVDAG